MRGVAQAVDAIVADGRIPAASIAVLAEGRVLLHHHAGLAHPDPPYDLASLTKPLAGATVAASLVEQGQLDLDDPAARWVGAIDPRITVGHLLDHTSGLPAWAPLHERCSGRDAIVRAACATLPIHAPGAVCTYSDLGFLALLAVLEAAGGARLDALSAPHFAAAGADLRWGWPGAAPTGPVDDGRVHDPIARAMGGVSAHAGLFGTALGVSALAAALADAAAGRRDDLPGAGVRALWARRGPGTHRGGWDGVTRGGASGRHWPADGVGHLGFTGTSVWIAPRHRVVVALLTNRVVGDLDFTAIRAARPAVHDAVARALGWDTVPG